jgi:hypothetical protein
MSRDLPKLASLLGFVVAAVACSNDDSTQTSGPDPAALATAPEAVKTICEQVCTAADQIRSKGCGSTEFASHSECYAQCVSRYLDYPNCSSAFDESNSCVRDAVCNAQTQCVGGIVMAAACMQAYAK